MVDIYEIINKAKSARATDVHISVGNPPIIRVDGYLTKMQGYSPLSYGEVKEIVTRLLEEHDIMSHNKEVDFSFRI